MMGVGDGIWVALHNHLATVFDQDADGYVDSVATDLGSLGPLFIR